MNVRNSPAQHHVVGERGVGEPCGDLRAPDVQRAQAGDARDRQRDERVADVARRARRIARHEVVQALGHPELRQAVQRRRTQEELLVGAERRRREDAREHDPDRERRHETDRRGR